VRRVPFNLTVAGAYSVIVRFGSLVVGSTFEGASMRACGEAAQQQHLGAYSVIVRFGSLLLGSTFEGASVRACGEAAQQQHLGPHWRWPRGRHAGLCRRNSSLPLLAQSLLFLVLSTPTEWHALLLGHTPSPWTPSLLGTLLPHTPSMSHLVLPPCAPPCAGGSSAPRSRRGLSTSHLSPLIVTPSDVVAASTTITRGWAGSCCMQPAVACKPATRAALLPATAAASSHSGAPQATPQGSHPSPP